MRVPLPSACGYAVATVLEAVCTATEPLAMQGWIPALLCGLEF